MRLDNRPKKLTVEGVVAGSERDEQLRRLLFDYEFEAIDPHPKLAGAQVISFPERYLAEAFLDKGLHSLDGVKVNWFTGQLGSLDALVNGRDDTIREDGNDEKMVVENDVMTKDVEMHTAPDLDVADDEDRWL